MKAFSEFDKIKNDFLTQNDEFTVILVEHDYFTYKGYDYLVQFVNTECWFDNDEKCEAQIDEILCWLEKNNSNTNELIDELRNTTENSSKSTNDIVTILTKLYGITSHRIPISKTLNPVIIEEGNISQINISLLVSLHKYCNYTPTIIVLLFDNDFNRAEKMFMQCPNNTHLKMIQKDGKTFSRTVLNKGAESIEQFLEFFMKQCFSTCSKTGNDILYSGEWSKNSVIDKFSGKIFKIRSIFVSEHKLDAKNEILTLDSMLSNYEPNGMNNKILTKSFNCMNKLFKVYCNDYGGNELKEALRIAKDLDNEILLAHVYRYSHFFDCDRQRKQELLEDAKASFTKYGITDHAIYCENNRLIHQFSMDKISINEFNMLESSAKNMPELALIAHIINNVGVAYMFEMMPSKAIDLFTEGIDYAGNNHIQRLALLSNRFACKYIAYAEINEFEARAILNEIFSPSLGLKRMTFLTAQFALNVIAVIVNYSTTLYKDLLQEYDIINLIKTAFKTNIMGRGSMIEQMHSISMNNSFFDLPNYLCFPDEKTVVSGIRLNYISKYGINPFFFNTWL